MGDNKINLGKNTKRHIRLFDDGGPIGSELDKSIMNLKGLDRKNFEDMLDELYRQDVERVANGQRAVLFGQLNDKPLVDVHPEYDLFSGRASATVASKGLGEVIEKAPKMGFIEDAMETVGGGIGKLFKFNEAIRRRVRDFLSIPLKKIPKKYHGAYKEVLGRFWRHGNLLSTGILNDLLYSGNEEEESESSGSFRDAFKSARERGDKTFKWEGKEYSTEMKAEGGRVSKWTKKDERDFQEWYASVSNRLGLNPDPDDSEQYYDYRSFWKENPKDAQKMLNAEEGSHFTDRYKLPGHPTFSNESIYSTDETPGGSWEEHDGRFYYVPSDYTKLYIDKTLNYLSGQNEGIHFGDEYIMVPKMPDGGYIAERDNTSIGGPGISERGSAYHPTEEAKENPIIPLIAGMIPVIGDAIDAHDLVRAAMENNVPEMALAASGFIPIVGDVFQEYRNARRTLFPVNTRDYEIPDLNIKESDGELLEKMPDYANPNSPITDALAFHRKRLDDGTYERATGRKPDNFDGTGRGLNLDQDYPGVYKEVFRTDFLDPYSSDIADILAVASTKGRDYFANMSLEEKQDYIAAFTNRMRSKSPAAAMGDVGGMGVFIDDRSFSRKFPMDAEKAVMSHEYDHAVRGSSSREVPKSMAEGAKGWFDASFIKDENTRNYISDPLELSARGSQIKDYFGLTEIDQDVTPEMLKYAARHYTTDVMDNEMKEFFSGIKDWKKAAKWISEYSTATAALFTIPKILEMDENSLNRQEKFEDGIKSSGGMIHEFIHTFDDGSKSSHIGYRPFMFPGSIAKRARYVRNELTEKYGIPYNDADRIVSNLAKETFLSDRHYNRKKKSYGIGDWSGDDLKEFVYTYRNGGLVDQIDFMARKHFRGSPVRESGFSHALREARGRGDARFLWNGRTFDTEEKRHGGALFEETGDIWTTGLDVVRTLGDGGLVERQDHVYERLTEDYGMPPLQAVAIIANLTAESGLDPLAEGDSGQSVGIQQWKGERRKRLEAAARKNGDFLPSLDDQIDFLMSEYKGGGFQFRDQGRNLYADGKVNNSIFDYYQYSKGEFDNADNLWDATIAWNQGVGRPNKKFAANEKRFKIAQEIADRHGVKYNETSRYDVMGPLSVPPESLYKEKDEASAVQTQENAPDIEEREKEFMSHVEELLSLSERKSGNVNIYVNDSADVSKSLEADDLETRRRIAESEQREKERRLIEAVLPGIQLNIRTI